MVREVTIVILLVLALAAAGCQPVMPETMPEKETEAINPEAAEIEPVETVPMITGPLDVLCLGDGEMEVNWGICAHFAGMAAAAEPAVTIEADYIIEMGNGRGLQEETIGSLKDLWQRDDVREQLGAGEWDWVVMYENLPDEAYLVVKEGLLEENPKDYETLENAFVEYSRMLIDEIEQGGGNAAVLVPWAHPMEAYGDIENVPSMDDLVETTKQVVSDSNALLVPTGPAWIRSNESHPEIDLFASLDGHTPSIQGVYLNAAILYALILERSPVGVEYHLTDILPDNAAADFFREQWKMTDEEIAILQQIAWETVQEYQTTGSTLEN